MDSPSPPKWERPLLILASFVTSVVFPVIFALGIYQSLCNHFKGYDVFLNFRGAEVRSVFVSHLYDDLREEGIKPFMDVRDFEKGYEFEALLDKIEESKVAVMVFSENYANSPYCLDELVKIMELHAPRNTSIPVFYKVNRYDVMHLKGSFGKAFESLVQDATFAERVPQWTVALKEAANIPGGRDWSSTSGGAELADLVVQDIMQVLEGMATSSKYYGGGWRALFLLLFFIIMALVFYLNMLPEQKYDVFVNYYGETTLATKIYDAFSEQGIKAFKDEGCERGTSMTSQIRTAIEESKIAVIIFSIGYASSPGCLDELVKIMECKNTRRLHILPVFFHVDPSDVRELKGKFKQEFDIHAPWFNKSQRWRHALLEAAKIPCELPEEDEDQGFDIAKRIAQHVKDMDRSRLIEVIRARTVLLMLIFSFFVSLLILALSDGIIIERLARQFVQWKNKRPAFPSEH